MGNQFIAPGSLRSHASGEALAVAVIQKLSTRTQLASHRTCSDLSSKRYDNDLYATSSRKVTSWNSNDWAGFRHARATKAYLSLPVSFTGGNREGKKVPNELFKVWKKHFVVVCMLHYKVNDIGIQDWKAPVLPTSAIG